jgi:hypothetical protein
MQQNKHKNPKEKIFIWQQINIFSFGFLCLFCCIRNTLGLLDPDTLVGGTDLDPSIIKQK